MSTDKISFGEWGESIPDVPDDGGAGGGGAGFFSRGKKKANADENFVSSQVCFCILQTHKSRAIPN